MSFARHWNLLLLLGVVVLVYGNSLQGTFHYDDFHSIVDNPHIRQLGNIPDFFVDPGLFSGDTAKAMYRPLLLLSYALNFALGGYEVVGYHIINVVLHGINACLVWWLVQLLGGRREQALWAGLLFALHPIGTEPVNYISSRSESLGAAFYLLGFCLFFHAVKRQSGAAFACSWIAFGLGLLSKSIVITLPLLLLLGDFLFLSGCDIGKWRANLLKRYSPYGVIAAMYILVITDNDFLTRSLAEPVREAWVQLLTQTQALVYYSVLLVLPVNLNVEHQFFEQRSLMSLPTLAAFGLVLSLVVLLIFLYRKRRDKIFFLSIWIVVTLLPVLVVPLNVLVNERRLYLPCAAFCIVLAFLGGNARSPQRRLGGQELGKVLGAIFLLSYGLLVFGRNQAWSDELSLWGDALTKSPAMPRVHVHLGNAWRGAGDPQRAGDAFIAALELDAAHRAARTNLANIYYEAAEGVADSNRARIYYGAAVREYEKVLSVDSTYVEALNGLGNAYRMLDDVHGAVSAYRRAIAVQPHFTQAHFNLASLLLDQGDYLKAVEVFRRLVSLGGDAAVYVGLGEAFFRQGKLSEAASAFQQACILDPGDPSHYYNWGIVLLRQGESAKGTQERQALWRQARVALQKVALLAPDYKQVESLLRQLAAEQL